MLPHQPAADAARLASRLFEDITMTSHLKASLFGLCLIGASTIALAQDAGKSIPADFAKLHKDLTSAKESWQTIPWHLSILEARAQAAKENKPVYMLCRAGHPLGCV
jgi:hypothetical protein